MINENRIAEEYLNLTEFDSNLTDFLGEKLPDMGCLDRVLVSKCVLFLITYCFFADRYDPKTFMIKLFFKKFYATNYCELIECIVLQFLVENKQISPLLFEFIRGLRAKNVDNEMISYILESNFNNYLIN